MKIRVVISGRGYDRATGVPDELEVPDHCDVSDAIKTLQGRFPADRPLPGSCLVAVSGTHLGTVESHAPRHLVDGDELVLIAPVAGG